MGYVGTVDRWDAIVGYDGFLVDDGEVGRLGIYLCYKSARGVNKAEARIRAMGGVVNQLGDFEIAGSVPVERIEDALKLIRVSKLKPGQARNLKRGPTQNTYAAQNRMNVSAQPSDTPASHSGTVACSVLGSGCRAETVHGETTPTV